MEQLACLAPDWLLRGWSDAPLQLVNWKKGIGIPVDENEMHVLTSCDGKTDFQSVAFLPRHHEILDDFTSQGIVAPGSGAMLPPQKYRLAKTPMLEGVIWAVTGRCNMKCLHCYMEAPVRKLSEPDLSMCKEILDKLEKANIISISMTGGEPFIRKDILNLIEMMNQRCIHLKDIYTNTTLISEETLAGLNCLKVDPVFRVSFDGIGAHDDMRGVPDTETKVLDAIMRIQNHGFRVSVATCVDERSLPHLIDTYECMKRLGVSAWGVGRLQPMGCAKQMTSGVSTERFAQECIVLLERWLVDGKPFTLGLEAFYSERMDVKSQWKPKPFHPDAYACGSCRRWPYISYDGTVMPCPNYGDTAYVKGLPLLSDSEWYEVWKNSVFRSLLDIRKGDVLAHTPECTSCEYLESCGTGCRVSALLSGSELYGKDHRSCELWKGGYKQKFRQFAKGE